MAAAALASRAALDASLSARTPVFVIRWGKLDTTSSDGAVASKVPAFLAAVHQRLLVNMRASSLSLESARADLLDAFTLLTGREAEVYSVLWQRAASFNWGLCLGALAPLVGNVSVFKAQIERLLGYYVASLSSKDPFVLLPELERKLHDLGKHGEIIDLVSANADLSVVVSRLISGSDVATMGGGPSGGSAGGSSAGAAGGSGVGSGTLTARNIDTAMSTKTFRDAVDDCKPLSGLDFVERNFRSGNALLVRYGATAQLSCAPGTSTLSASISSSSHGSHISAMPSCSMLQRARCQTPSSPTYGRLPRCSTS